MAPGVILFRPFIYDETTGINNPTHAPESLRVYPNPATGPVFIETPGSEPGSSLLIEVYDSSGRLVKKESITNGQLELGELSNGIYILKAFEGDRIFHSRVLLNR